jgi:hypothetical protein
MTADSTPGPGVDVMITIFCYFCQFSAEKNGVFSQKPMLWSHFWNQTSCSLRKNAIFFGENIFKIVTSVLGFRRVLLFRRRATNRPLSGFPATTIRLQTTVSGSCSTTTRHCRSQAQPTGNGGALEMLFLLSFKMLPWLGSEAGIF